MAVADALRKAWLVGAEDRLCGREEARAWALREVWVEAGKSPYGMLQFVASRVHKTKDGAPCGEHPTRAAVQQLLQKMDSDPAWYPGKHNGNKRGPKAS